VKNSFSARYSKNEGSSGIRTSFGSTEKQKPWILSAVFIMIGCLLGVFRAVALTPQTGVPDVLLIYVLALACFYDGGAACLTALCAGLTADVLGSETVGLLSLFYTAAAYLPDLFTRDAKERARWYFYTLGAFSVFEILLCFVGKLFGGIFSAGVFLCALRTAVYGAAVGSLLLLFTAAGKKIR